MYFQIPAASRPQLADFGESGMGFQLISLQERKYLVLNNEYAFEWGDYFENGRFYALELENLLANLGSTVAPDLAAALLIPNPLSPLAAAPAETSSLPPYVYTTVGREVFYRLSSFSADHCILNATDLRAKTYTTTQSDFAEVPSGLAAVGRFALPSRLSHIHVWKLEPPAGTTIYAGTVIPNFGMCGGGVEAYFPFGFTMGTITRMSTLPEM